MRITKLDGLRGICSLMVVLYHYRPPYLPENVYNNFLIRESYAFVDFFFVLSGFVIAYNYHQLQSWSEFISYLKKRFARLYPLLLYTTLFMFVVFGGNSILTGGNLLDKNYLLMLADSLFMTNSTPILGSEIGANPPSWSISAEMIAYIVFGGSVVLFRKRELGIALTVVNTLCLCFCLFHQQYFFAGDYGFVRGILAFNVGYFVWCLYQKKLLFTKYAEWLIPFLILGFYWVLNSMPASSSVKQIVGVFTPLCFGLILLVLTHTNGRISRFLEHRLLKILGDLSYSIYLNHYVIVMMFPKIIFDILHFNNSSSNQLIVLFVSLLIVIVYSYYTFQYVEMALGKKLRKWMKIS